MSDAEVHAIRIQLTRIASHLESELGGEGVTGNVHRLFNDVRSDLHELQMHIVGTPKTPGIATRLDRLEIAETNRARLNSAALIAIVSLVVKAGWDVLAR